MADQRRAPAPPAPGGGQGRKPPPIPKGPIKAKRRGIDEEANTRVSKSPPPQAPPRIDEDQMTVRRAAPKPAPWREAVAGGPRYRTTGQRWPHPLGQVFNAVDTETGDRVVVTMLHPAKGLTDAHVDASRAAANVLAGLVRPYLNAIVDVVRYPDNRLAIVTEYLNASVLAEQLGKKALPVPRVIGILRQLCRALGEVHRAGVSHGALSVASVLLTAIHGKPDHVVVTDFALQGIVDAELDIPNIGAALQPVTPERILGLPRSEKEDLYLIGCIGYIMLTGGPPFRTGTAQAVARRHAIEDPMPIEERLRSSRLPPASLTAVIHRCLSKEQEERFSDMADLEAELCLAQIDAGVVTPWDDLPLPAVDDDRKQRILSGLQKAGRGKPVDVGAPVVIESAPSRPISVDDLRTVARPMPKKPPAPAVRKAEPPPGLPQAFPPMAGDSGPIGAGDDEPTDRNEPLPSDDSRTVVSARPIAAPPSAAKSRTLSPLVTPAPRPGAVKPASGTIAPPAKAGVTKPAPPAAKAAPRTIPAPPIVATPRSIPAPPIVSSPRPTVAPPKISPVVPSVPSPTPIVAATTPSVAGSIAPVAPPTTPTIVPATAPTVAEIVAPSSTPTVPPSSTPTVPPSSTPTVVPSSTPTVAATSPIVAPSVAPSSTPTLVPSATPTVAGTVDPTPAPSIAAPPPPEPPPPEPPPPHADAGHVVAPHLPAPAELPELPPPPPPPRASTIVVAEPTPASHLVAPAPHAHEPTPIAETSARTVAPDPWAASVDAYDDVDVAAPRRPWALYAIIVAASLLVGVLLTRLVSGDDDDDDDAPAEPQKTAVETKTPPEPAPKPAQPDPTPTPTPEPEPEVVPETPTPTPTPIKRSGKKSPRSSIPRTDTPSEGGEDESADEGGSSGSSSDLFAEGNRAFNNGNYARAESFLSKAVKQSPGNARYRLSLGDALFKQGKYQIARIHYVKARELGHGSAARRIEAVDAKLGG